MWQLRNLSPFAADRQFLRDARGAEVWVVVVRATFDITPDGAARVAETQDDVRRTPAYTGEPGRSSLLEDTDFTLPKPAVDVLVRGHACAPRGTPAVRVDVAVMVGDRTKTAVVLGDRAWKRSAARLIPTEPTPFVRIPLVYERAFGGADLAADPSGRTRLAENPVGRGFSERAGDLVDRPLPNIEHPAHLTASPRDRPPPVGFGAVARDWMPRVGWSGTYDDAWENERRPLLPLDLDPRFWQSAPVDQQLDDLRGGEPVALLGLSPDGPVRLRLPRVVLGMRTALGREVVEHRGALSTVIVDADAMRLTLVFHSHVPCHGRDHLLSETVVWDKEVLARTAP
ncbi:DUF2169 domain-containing protein [Sorangium sp. So ce834]|uniref:DUF2169 family type VI secretion system accessory protein n=1 Tax=Sorangium sp. So ce834 TaxID=3133321 RepID=UPI003F5EDBD0